MALQSLKIGNVLLFKNFKSRRKESLETLQILDMFIIVEKSPRTSISMAQYTTFKKHQKTLELNIFTVILNAGLRRIKGLNYAILIQE